MFSTNEKTTKEGNNMKVNLAQITVEDVSVENLGAVIDALSDKIATAAKPEFGAPETPEPQVVAPDASDAESSEPEPEAPQGPTAEQFARAGAKLVGDHGYDYDFVAALLEDETVSVKQVLEIIPDWEDRLMVADILVESGWQTTPEEERELRHAAADIVERGGIRRDGKPLNKYQMTIVGLYACEDHRAQELIRRLEPVYKARLEEEDREVAASQYWHRPGDLPEDDDALGVDLSDFPEDIDTEVDYS